MTRPAPSTTPSRRVRTTPPRTPPLPGSPRQPTNPDDYGDAPASTVPGAFTMQAKPVAGLKKGDPVYATIVASGACGRVAKLAAKG